jgi:predicted ATPase/DNA-binding SARP family transcriptional activator
MRYVVLGPVTALDGAEQLPLGGPLQRAVLAVLIVRSGHPMTADQIVTDVWGDDADDRSAASLYTYVSNLRRVLGRDRLRRDPTGYRLVLLEGDRIDAAEFEAAVAHAHRLVADDPAAAVEVLDAALDSWVGRPYEGLENIESLVPVIAHLEELRFAARADRIDAQLRAGDTPSADEALQLCDERPLDERARGLLMRTLYRAGRQADALRTYRDLRFRLGEELGIEPSRALVELDERILLQDPALDLPRDGGGHLPTFLTSFVGRSDDRERLIEMLEEHRLVTLTGPGGVGKTRLAVEVASDLRHRFDGGVWLVDLASISASAAGAAEIATAVAATLRVNVDDPAHVVEQVAAVLRSARHLIVLDNCEHVREAAAGVVDDLLRATPAGITILATSRVALGVSGEAQYRLGGLPVGDQPGDQGDAERLFRQRSAAVTSDADGDVATLRALCRSLDGMPLALELAAARRGVLSTAEIADLLTRRFAVLVDDRQARDLHRSLEATVGWSWGLLDADERRAFAELGVFEGPFSVAAAVAVLDEVDDPIDAVAVIERLVAASLVVRVGTPDASTRYRLLETLRVYARDRLHDAERWDETVRRHDDHYLASCRSLADDFLGRERVHATETIGAELAEYQSAWSRSIECRPADVLALAWPLGNYWMYEGRLAEGAVQLRRLLEATACDTSLDRADALIIAAWTVAFRNQLPDAVAWTNQALGIYRSAGEQRRIAFALARAGHWAFAGGDGARGVALLQESLVICEEIGFEDGKAWPTVLLAQARRWSGDESPEVREMLLDARRRFVETGETYGQIHADMLLGSCMEFPPEERLGFAEEMVELSARPGGENLMRPIALHNLAYPVHELGDHERALGLNRAAVRSSIATGATMDLGLALIQAATFAHDDGSPDRVVKLAAAGRAHFGMEMAPFQRRLLDPALADARSRLGDARCDELERIGSALSAQEAAALALD